MRWHLFGRKWQKPDRRKLVRAALMTGGGLGVLALASAAIAGVWWQRRVVPEVRKGIQAYEAGDSGEAAERLEQARTELEEEKGALWLDRGLALAKLGKADEAAVALRRAAGTPKTGAEIRSEAHFGLGNLALEKTEDYEALQEFRQALRLWPEHRDAAWNLALAMRRLGIDACRLLPPAKVRGVSGQESEEMTAEVLEAPKTAEAGALKGLQAEAGFGPQGNRPWEKGWEWQEAEYAGEAEEGGGERYGAKVKGRAPGRYDYAFRFRQPGGEWAYCDQDGSNVGGYQPEKAGELWVEPPGNRCQIIGPAWVIVAPGQATAPVEVGVAAAEGMEIDEVEMGFAPDGAEPGASEWVWSPAEGNGVTLEAAGSIPAGSPRLRGALRAKEAGRYDYAFRWRPQGEGPWVHCDLDGSENGYRAEAAGDMVVREVNGARCVLDRPPRTQAAAGAPTEPIRVIIAGAEVADGTVEVEVGWGPEGGEPSGDDWHWQAAAGAEGAPAGWAGFEVSLTAPEEEGSFDYAGRFRRTIPGAANGGEWAFCDLDGAGNGYAAAMAGELLVQQGSQSEQQQDDDQDQEDENEQDQQPPPEPENNEPQDEQQQPERQDELPQDMESVLNALQQNERTFLPPQGQRQVRQDW